MSKDYLHTSNVIHGDSQFENGVADGYVMGGGVYWRCPVCSSKICRWTLNRDKAACLNERCVLKDDLRDYLRYVIVDNEILDRYRPGDYRQMIAYLEKPEIIEHDHWYLFNSSIKNLDIFWRVPRGHNGLRLYHDSLVYTGQTPLDMMLDGWMHHSEMSGRVDDYVMLLGERAAVRGDVIEAWTALRQHGHHEPREQFARLMAGTVDEPVCETKTYTVFVDVEVRRLTASGREDWRQRRGNAPVQTYRVACQLRSNQFYGDRSDRPTVDDPWEPATANKAVNRIFQAGQELLRSPPDDLLIGENGEILPTGDDRVDAMMYVWRALQQSADKKQDK